MEGESRKGCGHRTCLSPFRDSTSGRIIYYTQRQLERGAGGDRTPDCVLPNQPCTFMRLGWGDREPFSKWGRGGLCGWGEALPTTVKLHRVYLHQVREALPLLWGTGSWCSLESHLHAKSHYTNSYLLSGDNYFGDSEHLLLSVRSSKGKEGIRHWKKVEKIFLDSP